MILLKKGLQCLPWYGHFNTSAEVGGAFAKYADTFETISFTGSDFTPINGNMVYSYAHIVKKGKLSGKQGLTTLLHVFTLNDNNKIIKFRDFSDSAYDMTLL